MVKKRTNQYSIYSQDTGYLGKKWVSWEPKTYKSKEEANMDLKKIVKSDPVYKYGRKRYDLKLKVMRKRKNYIYV